MSRSLARVRGRLTHCGQRENVEFAVESCRGITQNNIPNLAHIGTRPSSFPLARLPTANSQRHSPPSLLLCCLYSLIHDSKQKHHGRRRSEFPSVHGQPVSLRSPPTTQITARQPKALPPRSHRQGRLCPIKVGSGVQGLSRIHRWLYELASESCAP